MIVTQLCPTLCDPMDCSPPGSSVHGFSRQEYWSGLPCPSPGNLSDSGIEPRSPALQADALPAETQAQEYWSGQPIPSPGDLPDPGIKLVFPALQGDSLPN